MKFRNKPFQCPVSVNELKDAQFSYWDIELSWIYLCTPMYYSLFILLFFFFVVVVCLVFFYSDPLSMYFSCFVDINSSKFQISGKVGKIFCNLSKRRDGTVGELVIQNLAPLPLHAMQGWDSELTDIGYVQNGISQDFSRENKTEI